MSDPSSAANVPNPGAEGSISSGTMIDSPDREARVAALELAIAGLRVQAAEAEERAARAEAAAAARAFVSDSDPLRDLEAELIEAQAQIRLANERAARAEAAAATTRDDDAFVTPRRVGFTTTDDVAIFGQEVTVSSSPAIGAGIGLSALAVAILVATVF